MQAVQIRAAALAAMEPVLLRVGAVLPAKVLERAGEHGLLMLAGAPVVAKLPEDVQEGARLRLQVLRADGDNVELKIVPDAPRAPQPAQQQAPPLLLGGGAQARVFVGDRDAGGAAARREAAAPALTLRYDSPRLGRMDLRITEDAIAVHLTAGAPAEAARAAAPELARAANVQVTIHPRTETVDVHG